MASSSCPKCTSTSFEVREGEPRNSHYKLMFVQCSSCGTVVGTMPYYDAGVLSKENQSEIAKLKQQLNQLGSQLSEIQRLVRR